MDKGPWKYYTHIHSLLEEDNPCFKDIWFLSARRELAVMFSIYIARYNDNYIHKCREKLMKYFC